MLLHSQRWPIPSSDIASAEQPQPCAAVRFRDTIPTRPRELSPRARTPGELCTPVSSPHGGWTGMAWDGCARQGWQRPAMARASLSPTRFSRNSRRGAFSSLPPDASYVSRAREKRQKSAQKRVRPSGVIVSPLVLWRRPRVDSDSEPPDRLRLANSNPSQPSYSADCSTLVAASMLTLTSRSSSSLSHWLSAFAA